MDIDTVIDDLGGLVDYLSDVPPEEMEAAELADWRRRLEAAADCLREIEHAHCGCPADDD